MSLMLNGAFKDLHGQSAHIFQLKKLAQSLNPAKILNDA